MDLRDRLRFVHWVTNDDLPAIYNLASCYVYPSLYEFFEFAQLEAMACGRPVAGACAGAIPEVSNGAAILFDPRNPHEIGEAILKIVSDADVRQLLVEKGSA